MCTKFSDLKFWVQKNTFATEKSLKFVLCKRFTPSTVMKFGPKFFWKRSFFDQNQQPLKSVEPFERILRASFISQCPYKFFSFLNRRNASNRFRMYLRDFRMFPFFFPGSACFSSLASPRNLPSWVKHYEKLESFGKEFRWTKFIAVERVSNAGRTTNFAPVKSLWFSELILGILLFEFRFTVFFPLGCGVDS